MTATSDTTSTALTGKAKKAAALKARERADYDVVAPFYDEHTTRITDPFGKRALELAGLEPGQRVMEIACGPAKLIPEIGRRIGPGGKLICFDQSDAMLAIARRRAEQNGLTNVELIQGDAEVLGGIADGSLDRILMVFGLMYLPDPDRALALMKQKLKPGGRMIATVWGMPADVPGLSVPMEAGARVLMPSFLSWIMKTSLARKLFYRQLCYGEKIGGGKTPMCLAPAGMLDGMFTKAGFSEVTRDEYGESFDYPDAEAYWTVLMGTPARTALEAFPSEKVERARKECAAIIRERHSTANGVAIPMKAITVTGRS